MAKKRRKSEAEEPAFKIPEFDEKAYLERELVISKLVFFAALLAIPLGVAAYAVSWIGASYLGALMLFFGIYIMIKLGVVIFNTADIKPKDWLGPGSVYLFLFLVIWILLLNVPFSDTSPPQIGPVVVVADGNIVANVTASTNIVYIAPNSNVTLYIPVTDASSLSSTPTISVSGGAPIEMKTTTNQTFENRGSVYVYSFTNVTASRSIVIFAVDVHDHSKALKFDMGIAS